LQCATDAKGKIERQHFYWQGRLPSVFAAENIICPETANPLLQALRLHRNTKEIHRELGRTPKAAADLARREDRNLLRPAPRCPWWPYVWSQRSWIKVGPDRRVPIGSQRLPVPLAPGSKVLHCLHPTGNISLLAHEPKIGERPIVLLSLPAF